MSTFSDYQFRTKSHGFVAIFCCSIAGFVVAAFAVGIITGKNPIPVKYNSYILTSGVVVTGLFLYVWYVYSGRISKCPSCGTLRAGDMVEREIKEQLHDHYKCRYCQHTWTRIWRPLVTLGDDGD